MFNLSPLELFGALIVAHMLCDYPLQGDFLAKAKNHTSPIPCVPWQQALAAHSIIHGGAVWLLTGIWWLGLLEALSHALIDWAKSQKHFGFHTDQFLHVAFKALWVAAAVPFAGWSPYVLLLVPIIFATMIIPPGTHPQRSAP